MRTKTILMTALFVSLTAALLWAQPARDRQRVHQELKLSEKQQGQLKELHFNTAREQIKLRADLAIARLELRQMMAQNEPDREMLFGKLEQIARIQTEMKKMQIEKRLAVRQILNKEQLDKLRELQRERRLQHWKKVGFRRPGRGLPPGMRNRFDGPGIGAVEEERDVPPVPEPEGFLPAEEVPGIPELGLLEESLRVMEEFPIFPKLESMSEPVPPVEELPLLPEVELEAD